MTNTRPWILGLSGSHNGAAALLHGDSVVVAIQEERLRRHKRAWLYPGRRSAAVPYCLDAAGIRSVDLELVVSSGLLPLHLRSGPSDNLHPLNDPLLNPDLRHGDTVVRTAALPHHFAHAVSAHATSGFPDCCVVVIDGAGSPFADWLPTERPVRVADNAYDNREWLSIYFAEDTALRPLEKQVLTTRDWVEFTDTSGSPSFGSLGGLFDAVGLQIFGRFGQAGKVMGLAPYGKVTYPPSTFFTIDKHRFYFAQQLPGGDMLSASPAKPSCGYTDHDANLAASVQYALEEAVLSICRRARRLTRARRLCLAGGVALNSVANERIIREAGFDDVYIFPAAEDSGVAIGAAFWGLWQTRRRHKVRRWSQDACGRVYDDRDTSRALERVPLLKSRRSADLCREVAGLLASSTVLGWFQGRSELGPRALGQRSILCDPRRHDAQATLNGTIKFREAFRPFAPAVLLERASDWFEIDKLGSDSPFMLRVCTVKRAKRSLIPAVVHVDGTARVQTVTKEANALLYQLLLAFEELTGVPILLNTSFNVMGEPLVETPEHALWSLLFTGLNACVVGDRICQRDPPTASALDLIPFLTLRRGGTFADDALDADASGRLGHHWADVCGARLPGLAIPLSALDGQMVARDLLKYAPHVTSCQLLQSLAIIHRLGVAGLRPPNT